MTDEERRAVLQEVLDIGDDYDQGNANSVLDYVERLIKFGPYERWCKVCNTFGKTWVGFGPPTHSEDGYAPCEHCGGTGVRP